MNIWSSLQQPTNPAYSNESNLHMALAIMAVGDGYGADTPQVMATRATTKVRYVEYTDATFILAPMAMKLREEGVPIKIVYLGHRDGSAVMVHKDSGIFRTEDLRGRRVAARILAAAVSWLSTRATLVTVRTQATNVAAATLYERSGFTLHASDLTFRLDLRRPHRVSL